MLRQHFVPHRRRNAPALNACHTSDCLPPTAMQHLSLATSWERPNYTNIGKVSVYVPPNVTHVEGMSGYLSSRDLLWRSHNLFISGKHIRDRVDNQHHSVRRVAKYANRGNAITMTRPISGLCTRVPVFAKANQSWEQKFITVTYLAPCTHLSNTSRVVMRLNQRREQMDLAGSDVTASCASVAGHR
jgi:hypothetical protein